MGVLVRNKSIAAPVMGELRQSFFHLTGIMAVLFCLYGIAFLLVIFYFKQTIFRFIWFFPNNL